MAMRLPLGPEFREEWDRFSFRFCCEDCCYLDRDAQACVHGWPRAEHAVDFYQDLGCRELVFCKEFELV
jgi:hypothetical protein